MKKDYLYDNELIVITGAAGFIGSGVVRHLNDLGCSNLLLVDDFGKTEKWKNLLGKEFVDILSKHDLFPFLEKKHPKIGAILHLGACSSTTETDTDYLMRNNYNYSKSLVKYAIRENIRFIYASSAATYGKKYDCTDQEKYLSKLTPLNMYGFSKHLFDLWLQRKNLLHKVVGIKYFNVFGPNEYHKGPMASMILKMAKKAHGGEPIQLFQSNHPDYLHGEQKRDFIYVKDAVRYTCEFLKQSLRNIFGVFNIGSGSATSWNDLANILLEVLAESPGKASKKSLIEYIPMPKQLEKQYQNFTKANMVKFFSLTEQTVQNNSITPIQTAVKEYVQEYILRDARW